MAELQQEAQSMHPNHTQSPNATQSLLQLALPVGSVAAVLALASCAAAPANPSGASGAYDASSAFSALPERETPEFGDQPQSASPPEGSVFFDLSPWEKSKLALNKSRKPQGAELDAIVEDAGEADFQPAQPTRPMIIWAPSRQIAAAEQPTYSGPDDLDSPSNLAAGNEVRLPNRPTASAPTLEGGNSPPVLNLTDLIPSFKSQLAMQAADSSSPLREHLVAASLLMLDDQRRVDPQALFDLTDREQDLLAAYQDLFSRIGEALRTGGGVDAVVKETQQAGSALTADAALRITDFRLCSRVVNYGLYDEIESYKFQAMRPTPLLTYVEIEGFKSAPAGENRFVTRVRHELELYTEKGGELVYSWPAAPAEDVCGKVRRDFFLPRQIQLPSNLTVGRYRLKVRIVDEQSQHQAESVVAFAIVAGGDVALRP